MSPSPIDDALAGHRRVHRSLLTGTAHRWRDLDMSIQQLRASYILQDEGQITVGRLAEVFGIGVPGASLLADRLVRAGLVERREDAADRRRVLLSLSRAGDRLVTDLREGSHALLRRWMSQLSPGDLEALSRGLKALAEVASPQGLPLEKSVL